MRKIKILKNNKTNFILIKQLNIQNSLKYTNIIFYYRSKFVKDKKLKIK